MSFISIIKLTLQIISVIFILAIFVLVIRYIQLLRQVVEEQLGPLRARKFRFEINRQAILEKWQKLTQDIDQQGQDMLKLKVIEADRLLEEVLKGKGFEGPTFADCLKQAHFEGLPGVEIAWQAHKVRNRLVHEGSKPEEKELRQALKNYEKALKKFLS